MTTACRRPAQEPTRKPKWRCETCGRDTVRPPICTRCAEQLCEQRIFFQ